MKQKLISIFIIIIGIIIGYKTINYKISYKITNKELVNIIFENSLPKTEKQLSYKLLTNKVLNYYKDTLKLLNPNLRNKQEIVIKPVIKEEIKPIIYLYNTHQTEEYETTTVLDYSIKPTVMISNYILEEIFNENDLGVYVEETSIKEILNNNNWNYSYSYLASRKLLEQRKKEIPSLKYFIDLHRDSLTKDKTTVIINNKQYAKLLFVIGQDHNNYLENLKFTEKINNKLNEKYPTLSKGIYQKGGVGVNGIYNQDFSKHVFLFEIGGVENNISEVNNTMTIITEVLAKYIKDKERDDSYIN